MQQVTSFPKVEDNDFKKSLGTIKSETLSDRDAGFCSGEETDFDVEFHSPAETSRDSGSYTKDSCETYRNKNKRKSSEPRKVDEFDGEPETKLIKLENRADEVSCSPRRCKSAKDDNCENFCTEVKPSSPFRPWNIDREHVPPSTPSGYEPLRSNFVQEEPLSLVVEKKRSDHFSRYHSSLPSTSRPHPLSDAQIRDLRIGPTPQEVVRLHDSEDCQVSPRCSPTRRDSCNPRSQSGESASGSEERRKSSQCSILNHSSHQRNYKNMTRERRIEANARERTRVHTISAAFDTLRKCVPAYANNQKLSKLSVLRIACSYIMTLSRIAGSDYSIDQSAPSISECVENVTNTIQLEGKTRKKKDE